EQIASTGTQRPALDGQYGATEHDIDLDLDLAGLVLSYQLGIAKVFVTDQPCLYAKAFDALGDSRQLLVDCLKFASWWNFRTKSNLNQTGLATQPKDRPTAT